MKSHLKSKIAGLCLLVGVFSGGAASAGAVCMSTCNERNTTCTTSGKAESTCLSAWHQCKVSCSATGKVVTKARVTSIPSAHVIRASTRG